MLQNVWVYKNSRNDNHEIAQKPKELTKVRDHVYFFTEDTDYGTWTHTDFFLVMENKGVFVLVNLLTEKTIREEVTWEAYLQQVENIIEGQRYFNELDLKLLETVSPQLWQRAKTSREADIRRREEETQKRLAREKEEQELIEAAMNLVTRSQEFYRREIIKDLESKQTSVISIHSCAFRNAGVTIFYDPENKLSDDDLKKPFRDIKAKYPEFHL